MQDIFQDSIVCSGSCVGNSGSNCCIDGDCASGYYCSANDCTQTTVAVNYQGQTPADSVRQIANSVTINVTVSSTGSNVDVCTLEWNGANETMSEVGSGTDIACYKTKSTIDGQAYTF